MRRPSAQLLVIHAAELATLAGPPRPRAGKEQSDLGVIVDGAVAIGPDGRIVAVGRTAEVLQEVSLTPETAILDAQGRAVIPGFVDPHTHAVFAGDRVAEFEQRLQGADYLAILAAGGGILQTVQETRAATLEELFAQANRSLDRMLVAGTTTVEIKSGYGLSTEAELKQLQVIAKLAAERSQTVVGTVLAAHAVPPEFRDRPDDYVELVCTEILPQASQITSIRFCDVFCEVGAFTVDQARQILTAGKTYGLRPKLHAEQKHRLGGAALAAEVQAVSADHLEYVDDEDIDKLRTAGVIAVLLPGAAFVLRERRHAPASRMIERGVPVALGTDFNPGTSPIWSMPLILGLACLLYGLTPGEALVAATLNAAYAIGLGETHGSIEPGKWGDLVILDAPSHRYIPYYFGSPLVDTVIVKGRVMVQKGQLCQ